MNKLQHPDTIRSTVSNQKAVIKDGIYTIASPAYSFTEIILK